MTNQIADPDSAYETAQSQLRSVATMLNLDAGLTEILASPKRELTVSTPAALPAALSAALAELGVTVATQPEAEWLEDADAIQQARIRLIGAPASSLARPTGGRPDLAVYANRVTESGRLELLPFLEEQAISITAHRFGTPDHLTDGII